MSKTRTSKNKNTPVVVVAGGAGFIGSHVTEALLNSGVKVIGVDDLVTGSIANIASFRRHPNYEFIECNLNQKIPESLSKASITHIISALGTDTHSQSRNATLSSLLTGSFATKNLLDLAVKTGARFLLLSTINIYDGLASSVSLQHYFGSSDIQKAQFSNYESKRYAEGLCQLYADEYNLDVRVARLSEVYGPRMDLCDKTFLDTMIQAVLGGQDLIVEHDGNQEIYLTYVEDVVYGLIKLLFAEGQNYPRSIYPFVSSEKVSVLSVAYTLRTFLPPGKEVKFVPQTTKDSQQLPTIAFDRTKKDLDWQPEVTITEGLKNTVESFQQGKSQLIRQHKVGRDQLVTQAKVTEKSKQSPTATPKKPSTKAPDTPSIPSSPVPLIQDSSVEAVNLPYRSTPNKSEKGGSEQSKSEVGSKPPGDKAPLGQKTSWWRRLIFAAVLIGLYATLGRPVLHTTAYGVNGAVQARQAASAAKSFDFVTAEKKFLQASESFHKSEQSLKPLTVPAKVVGLSQSHQELSQGLSAITHTTDGLATLSQAAQPWPEQLQALMQFSTVNSESGSSPASSGVDIQQLANQSQKALREGQKSFSIALAQLSGASSTQVASATSQDGVEQIGTPGIFSGLLQQARTLLSQAQSYLIQAEQALEVAPEVLGAVEQKTYLAMFQNSNELRPTGGFMGSYALIQVHQGQITTFKIDDIYNPDGQLRVDMAPPLPLQKNLGVGQMFIRDANWSPDVPTSAKLIAELYYQATKQQVDGVFFITTNALKPLLANLGPIYLQNFNETVTADNFDMLAQKHSNVGFVPGSTKKKDFIAILAESIMARMEHDGRSQWANAGLALSQGLAAKEIQIYVKNPDVMLLLDQQDWSGRIKSSMNDYLRVVDANIGANKSNYYVDRSTEYSINVDRNSRLQGVVKISWQHRGTSGTWPGGDLTNYVRVYTPLGAKLQSSKEFDTQELQSYVENGKQVFAGRVKIPYNNTKTVELSYALPSRLGILESSGQYNLLWQKQSGVVDEPLKISFNTPVFLEVEHVSTSGKMQDGSIVWQQVANTDQDFQLTLRQ